MDFTAQVEVLEDEAVEQCEESCEFSPEGSLGKAERGVEGIGLFGIQVWITNLVSQGGGVGPVREELFEAGELRRSCGCEGEASSL